MSLEMRHTFVAALVLFLLGMGARSAAADKSPAAAGGAKGGGTGAAIDRDYLDTCAKGNAKFEAHDIPGAIELYQKAIQTQPANPLAHYLVGEAELAAGNLADGEK